MVDPAQEVDRLLREDQFVYHRLVLLDHREVVDHAQAHVGAQHEHQSCVERRKITTSHDADWCLFVLCGLTYQIPR